MIFVFAGQNMEAVLARVCKTWCQLLRDVKAGRGWTHWRTCINPPRWSHEQLCEFVDSEVTIDACQSPTFPLWAIMRTASVASDRVFMDVVDRLTPHCEWDQKWPEIMRLVRANYESCTRRNQPVELYHTHPRYSDFDPEKVPIALEADILRRLLMLPDVHRTVGKEVVRWLVLKCGLNMDIVCINLLAELDLPDQLHAMLKSCDTEPVRSWVRGRKRDKLYSAAGRLGSLRILNAIESICGPASEVDSLVVGRAAIQANKASIFNWAIRRLRGIDLERCDLGAYAVRCGNVSFLEILRKADLLWVGCIQDIMPYTDFSDNSLVGFNWLHATFPLLDSSIWDPLFMEAIDQQHTAALEWFADVQIKVNPARFARRVCWATWDTGLSFPQRAMHIFARLNMPKTWHMVGYTLRRRELSMAHLFFTNGWPLDENAILELARGTSFERGIIDVICEFKRMIASTPPIPLTD